ncbi:putative 23S rRNA (guanosine(2251)-2'-O)-methyltransferase [Helianthus annuus]|nr:putative 23S rRNA (guanosine(2251)-2'-O)-methyltransferase [Helianthus annuus]
MYCNFTKCHAIPIVRASSQQPKCLLQFYINPKPSQLLPSSNWGKPICCSRVRTFRTSPIGFIEKTQEYCQLLGSVSLNQHVGKKDECFSHGVYLKPRNFSTFSYSRKAVEGGESVKSLPWLARNKDGEVKEVEKAVTRRSSWGESAERFTKSGREKVRRKDFKQSKVSDDELAPRKVNRSSWEESAEKFSRNGVESNERGRRFDERSAYRERRNVSDDESDIESEESDNPKWYKVQERFDRFDKVAGVERNDRFNRQDNWGRKVWKEASESSVPKMIGECVYGVGPVLAALSANRREFYVLYVQEGIDLTGNNKKKKDKKAFEKVLKLADKIGLTTKEISKHDLNMFADNRPHQGLVLDASPLEMVNIRQLDPVTEKEGTGLWLALDEVMDPQNLGAIIRSAYFFGASGVVLCAKNSAPLSGVVSKASAGSLELTELRSCKNMMQFLVSSAENGWRVLGGSVSSRAVDINEVVTGAPTILVLGSEGTGLRPLVERSCTQLVKIPGNIPVHLSAGLEDVDPQSFVAVESLNVSVAAGVLLHHLAGSKTAVNVE